MNRYHELSRKKPYKFTRESDLCLAFASCIPDGWTAYNETAGFDIVLVHDVTGMQIGIEAKLTLNAKVLVQAIEHREFWHQGPDFRAVLVGAVVAENAYLAQALGVTVLTLDRQWRGPYRMNAQGPEHPVYSLPYNRNLPEFNIHKYDPDRWVSDRGNIWFDQAPTERLALPEYVPDVDAGHSAPTTLSTWKIQAIKFCIWVERNGYATRQTLRELKLSPTRFLDNRTMIKGINRGHWVKGKYFPTESLRRQHPSIYQQIEDDYDKWSAPIHAAFKKCDQK